MCTDRAVAEELRCRYLTSLQYVSRDQVVFELEVVVDVPGPVHHPRAFQPGLGSEDLALRVVDVPRLRELPQQ